MEGGGLTEGVLIEIVGWAGGVGAADRIINAVGGAFVLVGARPGRVRIGRHGLCD